MSTDVPPLRDAEVEATANTTADAERVIKEQRVVTNGETTTTQIEETTVVVPSVAKLELRRYERARRTLYTIARIISIFVFIRFMLVLFGADPFNGFASFIYTITYPFILPFQGLFGAGQEPTLGVNVFEGSNLIAIAIYHLFAWIGSKVAQLVYLRTRTDPTKATVV